MIVALSWRASKAIGIVPGFCLETEAFATGKAAPALSAHPGKVRKKPIPSAKPVHHVLKLILKRLVFEVWLMIKPACPEFGSAAAKVTAQMSDTSALQISLLVRRMQYRNIRCNQSGCASRQAAECLAADRRRTYLRRPGKLPVLLSGLRSAPACFFRSH